MRIRMNLVNAMFLVAFSAGSTGAAGQIVPQNTAAAASEQTAGCPPVKALESKDLYGVWTLELQAAGTSTGPGVAAQSTRLTLRQNPEFAESLAGEFQLAGQRIEVFGDIEDGAIEFEESNNGKDISALWKGRVAEGSCGKAITGTRRLVSTQTEQDFVLRRAGW